MVRTLSDSSDLRFHARRPLRLRADMARPAD